MPIMRRLNRLEKQNAESRACERRRQNNVAPADRMIIYLPDNHREDVVIADTCTPRLAQVILYDPKLDTP